MYNETIGGYMLDISNYINNGYRIKIEQYVLINNDNDELILQVDHIPNTYPFLTSAQLLKKLTQHEAKD